MGSYYLAPRAATCYKQVVWALECVNACKAAIHANERHHGDHHQSGSTWVPQNTTFSRAHCPPPTPRSERSAYIVRAALGHGCHKLEKGCDKTCRFCCNLSCCPDDRPSPLFLSYTLLVNLPIAGLAAVAAIVSFTSDEEDDGDCDLFIPPGVWYIVSALLALFFCVFAIRIYSRFSHKRKPPSGGDIETGHHHHRHEKCARASCLRLHACHDRFFRCESDHQKRHALRRRPPAMSVRAGDQHNDKCTAAMCRLQLCPHTHHTYTATPKNVCYESVSYTHLTLPTTPYV